MGTRSGGLGGRGYSAACPGVQQLMVLVGALIPWSSDEDPLSTHNILASDILTVEEEIWGEKEFLDPGLLLASCLDVTKVSGWQLSFCACTDK